MKKTPLALDAFEPFIDKIEKLSKLYRLLISAGIFLVFIGVAVFLFYMPKYETIANLEKELAKLDKELQTAKANAKDLKKFQQKMKDAEEQFKIVMKVTGKFHNIAIFFDRVARLTRVVNIRDISMKPAKGNLSLTTSCTAVTYKFIENKPAPKKTSAKKKK
jgi:type IV pilus assembly protein PilO